MSSSLPMEIASTLQSASINRAPSPTYDLNPSTSASIKQPVKITHIPKYSSYSDSGIDDDDLLDDDEDVPIDVLRPMPRRQSFGPLPDLRFEQSYLASISKAETRWGVVGITVRDQVILPLLQGTLWTLALHGWKYWNRSASLSGHTAGSRLRRWWYKTNNWTLPSLPTSEQMKKFGGDSKLAKEMGDVSLHCLNQLKRIVYGRGQGFVLGWRWAGGVDVWSFC